MKKLMVLILATIICMMLMGCSNEKERTELNPNPSVITEDVIYERILSDGTIAETTVELGEFHCSD